jgi:phospholipid/cholesterol/gamma-HCH transport system substrate-binding protein
MRKLSREARIGLFLGVTLLILAIFIFVIGDLSRLFKPGGYPLRCSFDSALGLEKHTAVRLAGVKIGLVKDIQLVENRALITLNIYPGIKIPRDSKAYLASVGLLGERYVEILPGREKIACQPGEEIASLPSVSFDQLGLLLTSLGEEIKELSISLRRLMGPQEKENWSLLLANLAEVSQEMNSLIKSSGPELKRGVTNFSRTTAEAGTEIQRLGERLREVSLSLEEFIEVNRDELQSTLVSLRELSDKLKGAAANLEALLERLEKGEGTLGKLLQESDLYDQTRRVASRASDLSEKLARTMLQPDFRADYLASPQKVRGEFSFSLWPGGKERHHFFSFGLVRDPDQSGFLLNLQGGLRYGIFQARAGIMESELGAGVEAGPFLHGLFFSLEGFAFNRSEGPRLRFFSRYQFSGNFYFTLGVDDFGVSQRRSLLFGFGVRKQ